MAAKKGKVISNGDKGTVLYNHLYEACNILRGPVAADEYKIYLFPIMFLKRISDVYDQETKVALEESGGDMEYAEMEDNHRFVIPKGCHWNDIRNCSENIGQKINNSMLKIEAANPNTLNGIFSDFDEASWTNKEKLSDQRLKNLVEHFSVIKLDNENASADIMGQAYEFLIKKFADITKDSAGEFYTPRAVVNLIIRLLDPKAGETIYDPACGTGGMLIESMRHINDSHRVLGHLYGQEKNLSTASIARMNLFLHGCDDFHIERGDTLRNPKFLVQDKLRTFDCVVANPPFSLDNWGVEMWEHDPFGRNHYGIPPKTNADFAWVEHMLASMDPKTGRMGVVLPQGVLFKKEVRDIRRKLLEDNKLALVIQLAGNLFYGTPLAPCILFFSNNKTDDNVRFVDASTTFRKDRAQNFLDEEHVLKIFEYVTSAEDVEGFSKTVSVSDINDESCELSVSRYVKKEFIDTTPPYSEVVRMLKENIAESEKLEAEIKEMIENGGYLDE